MGRGSPGGSMRKALILKILIIFSLLVSCTQSGGLGVAPGEAPESEGISPPDSTQDSQQGGIFEVGGQPQAGFQAGEAGAPMAAVPIQHEGGTSGTITSSPGSLLCNKGGLGALMRTGEGDILQVSNLCVNVQVKGSEGDYVDATAENFIFGAQVYNHWTQQWQPLPKCGEKNEGPNFLSVVFKVKIFVSPENPTLDFCSEIGSRLYALEGKYSLNSQVLMGREEDLESNAPLNPNYIDPFILSLSHLNLRGVNDGPIRTPPSPLE